MQSLFCDMSPQGPGAQGHWGSWDPGHKVCTDRANPSPELRTPTGQQRTTQVHTGGSGPKQVAQFLDGRHLGSLWRSLLGPLRLTPPRRLQREQQAARWQQKRVCSDGRGPATRGRARAGAEVSVQPLPTTPGFPGQSGREQAGGLFLSSRLARGRQKTPPQGSSPHPWRQRLDGRGLVATGASQVDPLIPVDLVGEHSAQPESAVQRGLIERHATLAQAGGWLGLFHYGFGEERDGRGL